MCNKSNHHHYDGTIASVDSVCEGRIREIYQFTWRTWNKFGNVDKTIKSLSVLSFKTENYFKECQASDTCCLSPGAEAQKLLFSASGYQSLQENAAQLSSGWNSTPLTQGRERSAPTMSLRFLWLLDTRYLAQSCCTRRIQSPPWRDRCSSRVGQGPYDIHA